MTIETTANTRTATGNGATTAFSFPYLFFANTDLIVTVNGTTKTIDTDYSVTGAANPAGGTVTFMVAPALAAAIVIQRIVVYDQQTNFSNFDGNPSDVTEEQFDRNVMMAQQLADSAARSLKVPAGTSGFSGALPAIAGNGTKVLVVNAGETAFEFGPTTGDIATVALHLTEIEAVSADITNIDAVAADLTNINAVAGDLTLINATAVAGGVSVKKYGAVGDGTTSDQTAIAAAIAACISSGDRLYWPAGSYLTTATLANFHSVKHVGAGAVKRGSDLFYVEPKSGQTNILYVSTAGSDSNDGFSSSQPLLTAQQPFDLMFNYGPVLDGTWRIKLAAGTYTEGASVIDLRSKARIVIQGPDVGGHPNVPTAIIDGVAASKQSGLYFQDYMFVQVQDIKVKRFTLDTSSCGVVGDMSCDLYTQNVHTDANYLAGVNAESSTRLRVKGGIHENHTQYGVRGYSNSTCTIGYQGDAVNNRPQIKNNGAAGVYFHTNTNGHIDYCDLDTNVINVMLQNESRAHIMGNTLTGATTCDVWADSFSTWYKDTVTTNTFSSTTPYRHTHSVDLADQYFDIYDKTNNRRKWGAATYTLAQNKFHFVGPDGESTSSFVSSASHGTFIIDNNSSNYLQLGTPGGSVEAGLIVCKPSNAGYGQIIYSFGSDQWKMKIAGSEVYDFSAAEFYPTADKGANLGKVATRFNHGYIDDVVAATVSATTFTGALVGNSSTSSNLTGTPAVPNGTTATTQSARDNSTKLATTAYVDTAASTLGGMQTKSADYTLVLTDTGVLHPSADTTARTMTIPANASVAYPLFTTLTFINQNSAGVMSIAITTDTMRLSSAGSTGTRTLAANGVAVATKITTTEWIISGSGLT